MQITVNVKDGSNAEAIARTLRFQANLLDGMDPKKAASNAMTETPTAGKSKKAKPPVDEDETEETDEDEVEDEGADESEEDTDEGEDGDEEETEDEDESEEESEDEDEGEDDDADEDEDEEEPPKKTKGAKKLTAKEEKMLKEVNAALKARAKKTSFDKVKKWLKVKFKVTSINDLKPAQYAKVIKAAKVG